MIIDKFFFAMKFMYAGAILIFASITISFFNLIYILIKTDIIPHLMIKIFFIGLGLITIGILMGLDWMRYRTDSELERKDNDEHDPRENDTGE